MPAMQDLPSTLQRSPEKAQRTWAEAHDSAVQTYGEGQRAHRTAYAALKHTHRKVGDHWEAKEQAGPSDERAARGVPRRGGPNSSRPEPGGSTGGGVDENLSKNDLYDEAQRLDVKGRSKMSKKELIQAVERASEQQTRQSRERERSH